jgi:cardiolipin synthase
MDLTKWVLMALITSISLAAAGHALLNKRDPKAAWGWIAVCMISPLLGPLVYLLFGINRIHTRARKMHEGSTTSRSDFGRYAHQDASPAVNDVPLEFLGLTRTSEAMSGRRLAGGNRIDVLHSGEEAYPAMIETIKGAERTLHLATYIFETNRTGRHFIEALGEAVERGVDVRVLVDGIGELYSIPRAGTLLKRYGVRVERFLPPRLIPPAVHINLRNHRKILVADGRVAFTGGMNIGDRHLADNPNNPSRVVDAHFRLTGPIIQQIEGVFLDDWEFVTGERISRQETASAEVGTGTGPALCRTIVEGPNEDIDSLTAVLIGAVSSAHKRVWIMTPYFLPPRDLTGALQSAALRGVEVTVILPSRNNLPFLHWATRNMLWELLQRGVRVYYQPPPFAHTKLLLVDGEYSQIGSANIDSRSLRLNFELVVEVYDREFAEVLGEHFRRVRAQSTEVLLEELDGRRLPVKLRDSFAWLFSPYL